MYKFDRFAFMSGRRVGRELNQEELQTFDSFSVNIAISMDNRTRRVVTGCNTIPYSRLPKEMRAYATTVFDGVVLDNRWKKPKVGYTNGRAELISKIMAVFNISNNEAESCLTYKTVDIAVVEDLYTRMYDPENIKLKGVKNLGKL